MNSIRTQGFTLIEVMLALFMMSMVFIPLLGLMGGVSRQVGIARARIDQLLFASDYIARQMRVTRVQTGTGQEERQGQVLTYTREVTDKEKMLKALDIVSQRVDVQPKDRSQQVPKTTLYRLVFSKQQGS